MSAGRSNRSNIRAEKARTNENDLLPNVFQHGRSSRPDRRFRPVTVRTIQFPRQQFSRCREHDGGSPHNCTSKHRVETTEF